MGNAQSAGARKRPARIVGDRPELQRILPHEMDGGILVRLWLLRGFGLPDFDVPAEEVEWQFWNIVKTPDKPVEVLYGSDLDTLEYGSGSASAHAVGAGIARHALAANTRG